MVNSVYSSKILTPTSHSRHIRKRKGESGSPCLIPLLGIIISNFCPLTFTLKVTDSTDFIILSTILPVIPRLNIICLRNRQSTLSYALLMSTCNDRAPSYDFFKCFSWWLISWTISMLSVISRPLINALWYSDITSGRHSFSLFARTLIMIFIAMLQRHMGLNSSTV